MGHPVTVLRQSDPTPRLSRYWRRHVRGCAASVARFRRIADALPSGAAHTWLAEIAQRLDSDLDAVRRLAIVGDSIEPAWFRVRMDPAKRVARRLVAARTAFSDAVSQAAEVAERVALDPAHNDVRAHLDVLSRQASQLALAASAPPDSQPEPSRRWWQRRASA